MNDPWDGFRQFSETCEQIIRDYGRCVSCGMVFCEHQDHFFEVRPSWKGDLCWPRVCWIDEGPNSKTGREIGARR